MRTVRLRSSAIGNYTRSETDAPRTIFVLALIAAAGVALPWARGFEWSKHGWSYHQGLVALGAAVVSVCISAARADGRIGRTWFEAHALACALVGLGTTLWFYFAVVGATDPATAMMQFFGAVRFWIAGAIGLYVSMVAFLVQTVVLVWHLNFFIQKRARLALRSPWTAAALIGIAAIGLLLPWNHGWPTPDRGWSTNEGLVALAAATTAGIACGLRLSGRIRTLPYAIAAVLCASIGFAAVAWFHNDAAGVVNVRGYPLLVSWLNAPRSGEGLRESVTAAGFIGAIAVLAWQLWQSHRSNI